VKTILVDTGTNWSHDKQLVRKQLVFCHYHYWSISSGVQGTCFKFFATFWHAYSMLNYRNCIEFS